MTACGMCHRETCDCEMRFGIATRKRGGDETSQVVIKVIDKGREAWTSLHQYQGCSPTFVRDWEKLIPSYCCSCRKDYEELKKLHPFDYSTPDRFFLSGIALHNAVNRKLGKPEVSIDEARKIWNRPAT